MTVQKRDKLIENLHKVADYVKSNYIPMLCKCESLSVWFGKWEYYPSTHTREKKHTFGFSHDGNIWYSTGGLVQYFNDNPLSGYSIYDNPFYCEDLLLEWKNVKRLIIEELNRRAAKRAVVDNFEV